VFEIKMVSIFAYSHCRLVECYSEIKKTNYLINFELSYADF